MTATTLSAKKYFDGKSSLYELQNKWFEYQKELFKDKNIEILRRKHEGRRYIKNIEVFKAEAQKIADEMTEELKIEDIQIPEAKVHLNILKFIKKSLFGEQKVGRTENKIFLSQDEEINNYFFNIFEFQAQIENYDDIAAQIEEKNKTNSVKQNKISDKIKNFISNLSDLFNQEFYELVDSVKTKVKNFSINKQIEEKIPENDEIFFGLVEDYKNCEKEEKIEKLRRGQDRGFSR